MYVLYSGVIVPLDPFFPPQTSDQVITFMLKVQLVVSCLIYWTSFNHLLWDAVKTSSVLHI